MTSTGGVEAFLAAKWKSDKFEMELEDNEPEFQSKSPDLSSATETGNNDGLRNTPNKTPPIDDGVLIPVIKTSNLSGKSLMKHREPVVSRREENDILREDTSAVRVASDEGETPEGSTMTELKPVNLSKVGYYETTGDVWGLLEQQNEDDDQEEQEAEASAAEEKIDMVFGAISSEDMNKLGRGQKPESITEVPRMAIPSSAFGRLLGQPGVDDSTPRAEYTSNTTLKSLLSSQGQFTPENGMPRMTNPFSHFPGQFTPIQEKFIDEAIRRVMYPETRPQTPKRQRNRNPKTTEADSTTLRPHPQNDNMQPTNPSIIETNLHHSLLQSKPAKNRAIAGVKPTVYSENCNPTLIPTKAKDDIIQINQRGNIDPLTKTIIYNVVKYFQKRKPQFELPNYETTMAAEVTGISKGNVRKVMEEARETQLENGKPAFSLRSRKTAKIKFLEVNVKRDCIARMFIHNSYLIKKEVPTLKKIIQNCQENGFGDVLGTSAWSVKEHLKKLGFEYSAMSGTMKFLVERPDFIAQRLRYLEEMQEHRAKKRNIVYVFVTDLLKKGIKTIEWESWDGTFQETEQDTDLPCATIMHAAGSNYVFHDCLSVKEYEVNSKTGLPQDPVIDWLTQNLLPKVPKGSVVVLGDQRFHRMTDKESRPHIGHTKDQIATWLRNHGVASVDESKPKALLLEQTLKVVLERKYVIDDAIIAQGCFPVHIPTHHRDLNPLSFIWQDIKDQLDTANVPNLRFLRHFVTEGFAKSAIKLDKASTQVQKLEKSYYNIDIHTDAEKEALILQYGDGLVPIESSNETEPSSDDDVENEEPQNKMAKGSHLNEM